MKTFARLSLATALIVASAANGFAQEAHTGHDMAAMGDAVALPAICTAAAPAAPAAAPMGGSMGHTADADEAHTALMAGMDTMNQNMMVGATTADIDVAFVCGMIPHHQGAIDMAKAELQYGDNEWARAMAEKVIAAQEQEIADMKTWLEEQK